MEIRRVTAVLPITRVRQFRHGDLPLVKDAAHELLEEWAAWAREPIPGMSSGAEGYLREKLDQTHDSAEMTTRVELAEKALARLREDDRRGLKVLKRFYLARKGESEIAAGMSTTLANIKATLRQAKARFWWHFLDLSGQKNSLTEIK